MTRSSLPFPHTEPLGRCRRNSPTRWPVSLLLASLLAIQSVGCALIPGSSSLVESPGKNAADPRDQKLQAEACRRTALQLAAHEKDEHAIAQLERARELHPQIQGVSHSLAVLYDRQGKMDAAEREYRLALQESKNDADVLNDYGYFLYSRGDFKDAEDMLRAALKQKPDHTRAQVNLAMTLARLDRFDESFALFESAVGRAAAHHNIGMLMIRDGDESKGLVHLRKAAAADPSLPSQNILATLQPPRKDRLMSGK